MLGVIGKSVLLVMVLGFIGCTSYKTIKQENLGYIGNYENLQYVESGDNLRSFRWFSDELKSGKYRSVMLEPVQVLGENNDYIQYDSGLIRALSTYMDQALIKAVSKSVPVVTKPDRHVMRIELAISAIKVVDSDLKVQELLPIGAAIGLTKSLTGIRDKDVELYLEAKIIDSQTGNLVGAVVKKGVAANLWTSYSELKLEDLTPVVDTWTKHLEDLFEQYALRIARQ